MKNVNLWFRPVVLLSIWILVAALTLAELGTVQPLLRGAGPEAAQTREGGRVHEPGQPVLEARARQTRRRPVAR